MSSKCYILYYQNINYIILSSHVLTSQNFYRIDYKLKISIKHFNPFPKKKTSILKILKIKYQVKV